jgi:hypothetical protein
MLARSTKRSGGEGALGTRGLRMAPVLALLTVSIGAARAESAWPPLSSSPPARDYELELLWNDHYGLLQKKLPAWGREALRKHIEEVFREVGVTVLWLNEPLATERVLSPLGVRIVLMPCSGEGWRLPRNAMGAVTDKGLMSRTLYIFFPTVLRAAGDKTGMGTMLRDPRDVRLLALALARVVTHEVVHAIDPEIPHVEADGIMRAHLTSEKLRGDTLTFTSRTAKGLVAAISRNP